MFEDIFRKKNLTEKSYNKINQCNTIIALLLLPDRNMAKDRE